MKKIFIIIVFLSLIILAYYFLKFNNQKMEKMEKVSLITKDGVTIVGNYYPKEEAKFAGILIHQRPKTKESFNELAQILNNQGYAVVSIDLRGHGESNQSVFGKLDYTQFSEEEEKKSILDIEAASNFLKNKGFSKEKQFLIGASIGANLSFQFLSEYPEIKAVVLLSPGKNYRGVDLELYKKEDLGNKILVISSLDDQPAVEGGRLLKTWYPELTYIELSQGGHGTDMFSNNPNLKEKVINFLLEKLAE